MNEEFLMKTLKAVLIGAGNRGTTYTDKMIHFPEKFQVVAVAEPIESRREDIKKKHNIPDDMCFNDWRELLAKGSISELEENLARSGEKTTLDTLFASLVAIAQASDLEKKSILFAQSGKEGMA